MSKWKYTNNDGKHIINNERGVLIAMVCDEDIAIRIVAERQENERLRKDLEEVQTAYNNLQTPKPIDEWHEDDGYVLWFQIPVWEPPYCGTPLDSDWPGYHTHWTPLPALRQEEEGNQNE
ncbi:hypothetical protein [Paenibacillus amylolyticus]|uniref:DUF551 domain-containing protein n=1 Tax=Paenibacillus amylolyticus TaxID=1451 RepID=A0ABD8B3I4_PAEAM